MSAVKVYTQTKRLHTIFKRLAFHTSELDSMLEILNEANDQQKCGQTSWQVFPVLFFVFKSPIFYIADLNQIQCII